MQAPGGVGRPVAFGRFVVDELWVALALVMVVEGLFPALAPGAFRAAMVQMAQLDDRALRIAGLASMVLGALFLYFLKN